MDDLTLMRVLRALAHKARFRIVQAIARAGELSCNEVGQRFDLTQPTISHHLKILAVAEVLLVRREGQHAIISVNHDLLNEVAAWLPRRLTGTPVGLKRPHELATERRMARTAT